MMRYRSAFPPPLAPSPVIARRALATAVALGCGALLALPAERAQADAFQTCPTDAFLTQGSVPRTYAVNLVTGDYTVAALTHGTSQSLNAVGFNPTDRYLYAWSKELGEPVRIHADWTIEPLGQIDISSSQNFYVGDVSEPLNKYFVYQRGGDKGLYSIDLDPASATHLQMARIIDGDSLDLQIYDLAFHPTSGLAYAVDLEGDLHGIDPSDGSSVNLGNTGETGTFGATYFDAGGNLYIGRNSDGKVFRIRPDSGDYSAELFANGPSSSINDGSRCAVAPLPSSVGADIDYGSAPDSYGTSLDDNGARHGRLQNPGLFLGAGVDGESDGYAHPLSDDTGSGDDDDGVTLVSPPTAGDTVLAVVSSSDDGLVNAWIDVGRDGRFDTIDQVLTDRPVSAGDNNLAFTLPATATPGPTWARFRLSTASGLEPTGGAPDGEVEDFELTLLPTQITTTSYPSESGWATVAFEDNWPFAGDYDMNDLVVRYRTTTHRAPSGYTGIEIDGELAALGASYRNGFGIAMPGVARSDVDEAGIEFAINGVPVTDRSVLEPGRQGAILIIDEDMHRYADDRENEQCAFLRTEPGCGVAIPMAFTLSVPFVDAVDVPTSQLFDPFLFATPGQFHGAHFSTPPGRSYEIHLKNRAPTEAFDLRLFSGVGQDASAPDQGLYFQTGNGMPWALSIGERWEYPLEYQDVSDAYPDFVDFSLSSGTRSTYWYDPETANPQYLFKD